MYVDPMNYTAAIAALAVVSPADTLSKHEARQAIHKDERRAVQRGTIDGYRIGRCQRRAPRRVRCYVVERVGPKNGSHLTSEGWTGVWLRNGRTTLHYPRQRG